MNHEDRRNADHTCCCGGPAAQERRRYARPYALRIVLEIITDERISGLGEIPGHDETLAALKSARETVTGRDPFNLNAKDAALAPPGIVRQAQALVHEFVSVLSSSKAACFLRRRKRPLFWRCATLSVRTSRRVSTRTGSGRWKRRYGRGEGSKECWSTTRTRREVRRTWRRSADPWICRWRPICAPPPSPAYRPVSDRAQRTSSWTITITGEGSELRSN